MKKLSIVVSFAAIVGIAALLLHSPHITAQLAPANECTSLGFQDFVPLRTYDSSGVQHQNLCFNASAQPLFPAGRFNATNGNLNTGTLVAPVFVGTTLGASPVSGTSPGTLSTGSITPTATAATIGIATQTFTLTGVVSGDPVTPVSIPAPTALCPLVSARATASNIVSLDFAVLTAAACTPASGTYKFLVPR